VLELGCLCLLLRLVGATFATCFESQMTDTIIASCRIYAVPALYSESRCWASIHLFRCAPSLISCTAATLYKIRLVSPLNFNYLLRCLDQKSYHLAQAIPSLRPGAPCFFLVCCCFSESPPDSIPLATPEINEVIVE
jgi:hypothetical protein